MLCEKCGQTEALVHTYPETGPERESHLCFNCGGVERLGGGTSGRTITISRDGLRSEPMGFDQPEKQVIPYGLAALASATARLFESEAERVRLSVFANLRQPAFLYIRRRGGQTDLRVMFTIHNTEEFQSRVIEFLSARRIHLRCEIGIAPDDCSRVRNLSYLIPGRPGDAANLLTDLLRICYKIKDSDALTFTFFGT